VCRPLEPAMSLVDCCLNLILEEFLSLRVSTVDWRIWLVPFLVRVLFDYS
jgi:hypothetical protein